MRARTKVSLGLLLIVGLALFILAIKLGFLWFLLELFLGALVAMYLYRFLVGLLLLLIRSGTKTLGTLGLVLRRDSVRLRSATTCRVEGGFLRGRSDLFVCAAFLLRGSLD